MNLNRLIIVSLVLTSNRCLAEIFKLTSVSKELTTLAETTVEILTSCYDLDVNTVGLAGILESTLFETLWTKWSLSVTLIGDIDEDEEGPPVDRISRYKLQTFVVTASSLKQLQQNLNQTRSSQWWNHMATFFIVDWQTSDEHECSNAFEFLWAAWQMNLLNAFYVCFRHPDKRLIYNYNPFTPQAPVSWQPVKTYAVTTGHPWTLLMRKYRQDRGLCEGLEFDKTTDLAGYTIRCTAKEFLQQFHIRRNRTGLYRLGGYNGVYAHIFLRALNATAKLKLHDADAPGLYDINGNDIAMDTANGDSDILLVPRYHSTVENFTTSYAYHESGLSVLTQYSGQMSQISKILTVLDGNSHLGLCLVFVMTMIFFKYFLGQTFMTAVLNILRISCNSTLPKLPENMASRIYLAAVFLLAVTILAIYQGNFASLLTKPMRLPNVDTMQDLAEHSHTVNGHETYTRFFNNTAFAGRYVAHENYDCVKYVVQNSMAACVLDRRILVRKAVELKLHLSKEIIVQLHSVYVIRPDWPLEKRFNRVLAALTESGITQYTIVRAVEETESVTKFYEELENNRNFRIITLSELGFAFAILGVGLTCAAITFIVEIIIGSAETSNDPEQNSL